MNTLLIHAAFFLAGLLALAAFAGYICRGRPVTLRPGRRQARERRTLKEIECRLLAEAETSESDHSLKAGVDGL
jgi:hypothetical protein